MERHEVIYHIDSDAGLDGVEVSDIAGVMCSFAELVQSTLNANDVEGELEVKVRPFREGSFLTEFVLTFGNQAVTLFSGPESTALANALAILGFVGVPTMCTLPAVVRKVKGRINEYVENDDGTYTYGGGLTVPRDVHNAVQSPEVARSFRKTATGPIVNIGGNVTVTIQDSESYRERRAGGDVFTDSDVADIDMYEHVAVEGVPEDREEILLSSHDVVLMPKSGPYDGAEKGYTFKCGEDTWSRVQMHDPDFRLRLERGDVRFMNKDVLVVDMEAVQTVSMSGDAKISERRIMKVTDYRPYRPSKIQMTIDDMMEDED